MDNLKEEDFLKKLDELRANYTIWVGKVKEQYRKKVAEDKRHFEEIPPAQDSPKHILNVLTDECIQKILSYLDFHIDLFNAAETCTRFQNNAKICFPSELCFLPITIEGNKKVEEDKPLPIQSVPKYLTIFGHLTKKILWSNRLDTKVCALDDKHFQIIADSCGNTLTKFQIYGEHELQFNPSSPFYVLEKLSISYTSFSNYGLEPFSTLKKLELSHVKIQHFDVSIKELPTLEIVSFDWIEGLTDDLVICFQKCVPKLKNLNINQCKEISPSIFQNVDQRIPNLEHLEFRISFTVNESEKNEEDILDLSKLKKLKIVCLYLNQMSIVPLVNLFAEREVPIEELMTITRIFSMTESFYKLKRLKVFYCHVSEETAIQMIDKIPTLEKIWVDLKADSNPSDIVEFIEYALNHKLNFIKLCAKKMSIDTDSYNTILALSKSRIRIHLFLQENLADLDEAFVEANHEWFNISDYKKEHDPENIFKKRIADMKIHQKEIKDAWGTYDIPDFI